MLASNNYNGNEVLYKSALFKNALSTYANGMKELQRKFLQIPQIVPFQHITSINIINVLHAFSFLCHILKNHYISYI